jgi:H+-translocating NAD(P) transhydrogenase subunit alpha
MTTVGVLRETAGRERRVALTPDGAGRLRKRDVTVLVEAGAGAGAWFEDIGYSGAGAEVVARERVYAEADVLLCLHPPGDAADACRPGQVLVGLLQPLTDLDGAQRLAAAGVTAISLDLLPRTLSRAQAMDALTSQANVAGYKAALLAAEAYPGFFPMLMTAAGTTRPAQVLVLGAGVAGLQAIATARRLGALVTGYDVRAAARADIASTGAAVLDTSARADESAGEGEGGYARTLSADEGARQQQSLEEAVPRFDVVITTAQVPGGPPPRLVSENAISKMRPGSIVVDLAASALGGNVEGSVPDKRTVTEGGITVIGAAHLAATVPSAASTAYARNVLALLTHLMPGGEVVLDLDDEIQRAVIVTHGGRVAQPRIRALLEDSKEIRS